jgi:hypothetical protein
MSTQKYVAADGTVLTDEVVEDLAREAEHGFPDADLTDEPAPWSRPEPMETHSLRVPAKLWELVEEEAHRRKISTSEYARDALSRSLLSH